MGLSAGLSTVSMYLRQGGSTKLKWMERKKGVIFINCKVEEDFRIVNSWMCDTSLMLFSLVGLRVCSQ